MLIGSICQKSFQILENFCTFFAKFLHIFAKILQNFLKHFFQKKKGTRGHQFLILQPLLEKTTLRKEKGTSCPNSKSIC